MLIKLSEIGLGNDFIILLTLLFEVVFVFDSFSEEDLLYNIVNPEIDRLFAW